MTAARRKIILGLALALTAAAALWPLPEDESAPAPRKARDAAKSAPASTGLPALPRLADNAATAADEAPAGNLFPAQTWMPPPPPVSEQAAAPVAPPLPFRFGGRYVEGGQTMVFLIEGERVHSVRLGDTINAAYRIDAIEAAAVQLTYLPLNTRQSLPTGSLTPQ